MLLCVVTIFLSLILASEDVVADDLASSSSVSSITSSAINSPYPPDTCEQAWFEATMISNDDIQESSRDLDFAIGTCQTLADWMSQAAKYPQMLYGRDAMVILEERCRQTANIARICG